MTGQTREDIQQANRRIVRKTLLVVVAMFGFGYALVPVYSLLCQALGINGQTEQVTEADLARATVDKDRVITVQLNTMVNSKLPWGFRPEVSEVQVHPGELKRVKYVAENRAEERIIGQAIHSVMPVEATRYFKKTECFCYSQQMLEAGESKEMTVLFMVDPNLPKEISTVVLSYNFLRADKYAETDLKQDKGSRI